MEKDTEITSKNIPNFICEICDFKCCKKGDYRRHILTLKHKNNEIDTQNTLKHINYIKEKEYMCECGSTYKFHSGLWRHKKKCNLIDDDPDNEYMYQGINIKDKDALVLHLLKQNGDLQNKIIEMASQSTITNNNNNFNTTNIDKNFNLNFFLNNTCKDAMNITDFVSSIQMNLADLEHTGRSGYIEGISNIILNNLNKLEQHMRPLHCSDIKREILYIKYNDEWTKETNEKPILTKAIKTIANENIKQISKWKDNYPDCIKSNSKKNDLYLKIVSNSMSGTSKEDSEKNYNKIITNVAKKVIIEK